MEYWSMDLTFSEKKRNLRKRKIDRKTGKNARKIVYKEGVWSNIRVRWIITALHEALQHSKIIMNFDFFIDMDIFLVFLPKI
jgi:hypothetical protein